MSFPESLAFCGDIRLANAEQALGTHALSLDVGEHPFEVGVAVPILLLPFS